MSKFVVILFFNILNCSEVPQISALVVKIFQTCWANDGKSSESCLIPGITPGWKVFPKSSSFLMLVWNVILDETNIGHKLLSKMGWSAGKGLGKAEQGVVTSDKLLSRPNVENKGPNFVIPDNKSVRLL